MARKFLDFKIEFIATGNELLDGTISDTNSTRLAIALRPLGLQISKITVVADDRVAIQKALTDACSRSDAVLVSGGLGPTSDDITVEVAAKSFGAKLVESEEAKQNIVRRIQRLRGAKLNPSNLKQALIPKGARVLENEEGTAPALHWSLGDRDLFFLPGVPREFDYVLKKHLLPFFLKHKNKEGKHLFILKLFGKRESDLNELMKKIKLPPEVELGFRAHMPEVHLKFLVTAPTRKAAEKILQKPFQILKKKLGDSFFSDSDKSFEESIVERLIKRRASFAVAESCTGGLLASLVTRVSGASKVFERGFVTYSNLSKEELLGVKRDTLKKFGAVSRQVVVQMAEGARARARVSRAVAITGIAGPTGGTKEKPVGTVWIASATKRKTTVKLLQLPFNRELNQKFSAYWALKLLAEL